MDATLLQLIQGLVDLSQEASRLQARVQQLEAEREQRLDQAQAREVRAARVGQSNGSKP